MVANGTARTRQVNVKLGEKDWQTLTDWWTEDWNRSREPFSRWLAGKLADTARRRRRALDRRAGQD